MLREAGAPPVCPLGKASTERYSRQLLVPDVGVEGHTRIGACSVLVVGAGGLGSPCALYLAGAGASLPASPRGKHNYGIARRGETCIGQIRRRDSSPHPKPYALNPSREPQALNEQVWGRSG